MLDLINFGIQYAPFIVVAVWVISVVAIFFIYRSMRKSRPNRAQIRQQRKDLGYNFAPFYVKKPADRLPFDPK